MPTIKKPSAARGGRRGKHREKRLKMLEAKPHWLASEAPVGEYQVDTVALELFFRGAAVSNNRDEDGFVRLVREEISISAQFALIRAKTRLLWRPEKLLLTRRLFKNVRHIQSSIRRTRRLFNDIPSPTRRNESLNPSDLRTLINPISIRRLGDQDVVEALQSSLRLAEVAIRNFLKTESSYSSQGNYDWLTRCFIDDLFELWCRWVWVELNNEAQVFNKLLVAAWRDVRFPTREQAGERLEDWLADRVRKHFSDGVCSSRRDRQGLIRLRSEQDCRGAELPPASG
jgi:hypothetical protein